MENNINLKELWNTQPVPEADQIDLLKRVEKHKAAGLKKIFLLNVLLLATILFLVLIWINFEPQLRTTKIGLILIIVTMAMALVFQNRMIPLYTKTEEVQSNTDCLQTLLKIKNKERMFETTIVSLYFLLMFVGMALYLYEYTLLMPLWWGVFAYSMVTLYMGINWFVLRPKIIKKNREKTDGLIRQLEKVRLELNKSSNKEI